MSEGKEDREKMLEFRTKVLEEIVTTEKVYSGALRTILTEFLMPLKVENCGIKKPQLETIFANIEEIHNLHVEVLYDLELCMKTEERNVGKVFSHLVPHLKLYRDYCANYQNAIETFAEKMSTSQKFSGYINKKKSELGKDFTSFLIRPIQRIPRYKLLFTELLKNTPKDHDDLRPTKDALKKIEEVRKLIANYVNESIRERDNYERLVQIQQCLTGSKVPQIVKPTRKYIREGVLVKLCRKDAKRRQFYLFSDMLIYASINDLGKEESYTFHRSIEVEDLGVSEVNTGHGANSFQVLSSQKSFTVFAENEEEKKSWIDDINLAVRLHQNAKNAKNAKDTAVVDSAPVWVPDKLLKNCMLCPSKFTTINRRHHCRKCGKLVCNGCSSKKFKLPNIGKMCRVCDQCYSSLTGEDDSRSRRSTTIGGDTGTESAAKEEIALTVTRKFKNLPDGKSSSQNANLKSLFQRDSTKVVNPEDLNKETDDHSYEDNSESCKSVTEGDADETVPRKKKKKKRTKDSDNSDHKIKKKRSKRKDEDGKPVRSRKKSSTVSLNSPLHDGNEDKNEGHEEDKNEEGENDGEEKKEAADLFESIRGLPLPAPPINEDGFFDFDSESESEEESEVFDFDCPAPSRPPPPPPPDDE